MTPKEIYKWAQEAGIEDLDISIQVNLNSDGPNMRKEDLAIFNKNEYGLVWWRTTDQIIMRINIKAPK